MTATIEKHSVVQMKYTLKNDAGEVLDSSEGGDPLTYMHGTHGLIPGLESELDGKKAGDSFQAVIAPELGYGEVNLELIHEVDRAMFRGVDNIEPGMVFTAQSDQGQQNISVTAVEGDKVTVDGNHPMAGKTLHFDVEVISVRAATQEEIEHGHVHGEGGHDH